MRVRDLDPARITMEGGWSSSEHRFGSVVALEGREPLLFELTDDVVVREVTPCGNVVLHVTHPQDAEALGRLQSSVLVLVRTILTRVMSLTLDELRRFVARVVVRDEDDAGVHVHAAVIRRDGGRCPRTAIEGKLCAGARVRVVLQLAGTSMDADATRVLPHIVVRRATVQSP